MATPSPAERQELLTDIGRRLDHLPIGPMHLKVVVAIGLGLFFEVYEIFLSSTIATALKTQYGLGGRALELLLASSFLGMFIGAAVFGRLADRIGRRRAFLLNLCGFRCGAWSRLSHRIRGFWWARASWPGLGWAPNTRSLTRICPMFFRRHTVGGWLPGPTPVPSLAVPVLGFLSLGLT